MQCISRAYIANIQSINKVVIEESMIGKAITDPWYAFCLLFSSDQIETYDILLSSITTTYHVRIYKQ